jgi:Zn-finger nucleic acid-binding protein
MRSYERNQVHVDQCTGCGGLFLDRGELEALVAAENAWHQQPAAAAAPPPQQAPAPQPTQQGAWQQQPAQSYQAPYRATSKAPYGGQYGYGQRRKKSFLSELFD